MKLETGNNSNNVLVGWEAKPSQETWRGLSDSRQEHGLRSQTDLILNPLSATISFENMNIQLRHPRTWTHVCRIRVNNDR